MSWEKARSFYDELTLQQKQFVDEKTISATLSVKNWIAFLNKATAYDEYLEKVIRSTTRRIILLTILLIGSLVGGFALVFPPYVTQFYWLVVSGFLGIFLLIQVTKRRTFKGKDINNYLRLFFMPFLEVMRVKAGEDAKLAASLDFREPLKDLEPIKRKVGRGSVSTYEPKFIVAKITLLDQSYLETVVADEINEFRYRNPNGKFKRKTKTVHRFFIRLTIAKSVYAMKEATLPKDIEMSEGESEYFFKLKGKSKELGIGILSLAAFFSSLQAIYNLLTAVGASPFTTPATDPSKAVPKDTGTLLPTMLWTDSYFSNSDYDSTRHRGDIPLLTDGENKTNIFDS